MIMDQLLDNALKFSPQGVTVHVSAGAEGDTVSVVIQDDGVGLSSEDGERIFDRFVETGVRGDLRKFGGIGLGLYIFRHLARDLLGDVHVHSLQGGTRMRLTLPREQPSPGSKQHLSQETEKTS